MQCRVAVDRDDTIVPRRRAGASSLSRYTGRSAGKRFSMMPKDGAQRLVLGVEDDVSVRRPLVKFLEMHGFAVLTAETADEGLDALKKNSLVAAVIDLRLKKE